MISISGKFWTQQKVNKNLNDNFQNIEKRKMKFDHLND